MTRRSTTPPTRGEEPRRRNVGDVQPRRAETHRLRTQESTLLGADARHTLQETVLPVRLPRVRTRAVTGAHGHTAHTLSTHAHDPCTRSESVRWDDVPRPSPVLALDPHTPSTHTAPAPGPGARLTPFPPMSAVPVPGPSRSGESTTSRDPPLHSLLTLTPFPPTPTTPGARSESVRRVDVPRPSPTLVP